MRGRTFVPDDLSNLKFPQLAYEPGAEQQTDDQRCQTRRGGAERYVLYDVQHRHLSVKLEEEVEQHQANSALRRSTTTSVRMPREPLTRTISPDFTSLTARSPAAVLVST